MSTSSRQGCTAVGKFAFASLLVFITFVAYVQIGSSPAIAVNQLVEYSRSAVRQTTFSAFSVNITHPRDFGQQLQKRQNQTRSLPIYYSSVVAFGDSYTDNAHSRPAWQNDSIQRNYFAAGAGRSTNGRVEVEYMVSNETSPQIGRPGLSVALYDYALGGTQIDNTLSYNPFPSAKDQIEQYLSELSKGSVRLGGDRILHFYFSGINPMYQIFVEMLDAGMTDAAKTRAASRVTANTNAIRAQLAALQSDSRLTSRTKRADFLLLSLPALWYNPFFWQRAWNGNSIAVAGLTDLTNQFNSELRAISTNLTQSVATRGGKVFYGDLSSLWVDMSEKPRNYGFTIPWIFDPCWKGDSVKSCSNPDQYLMWDTLHPTSKTHSHIAVAMNRLVKGM